MQHTRFVSPLLQARYQQIKASFKIQSFQDGQATWDTGQDGSFICMYIKKQWEDNIPLISQLLNTFEFALTIPNSIALFLKSRGTINLGMNYLSNGDQVSDALVSLGFQSIKSQQMYLFMEAPAVYLVRSYFQGVLAHMKGNISQILPYLRNGMRKFQAVTQQLTMNKQAQQIVVTITAQMSGNIGIISINAQRNKSSQDTAKQVASVLCDISEKHALRGKYMKTIYINAGMAKMIGRSFDYTTNIFMKVS